MGRETVEGQALDLPRGGWAMCQVVTASSAWFWVGVVAQLLAQR